MLRKLVFALITLCCFAFLLGAWWYNDRPAFLYPPLPFQTVEKKVVVSQLKQADDQLRLVVPRAGGCRLFLSERFRKNRDHLANVVS